MVPYILSEFLWLNRDNKNGTNSTYKTYNHIRKDLRILKIFVEILSFCK